jgi:hypothetical protein
VTGVVERVQLMALMSGCGRGVILSSALLAVSGWQKWWRMSW